MLKTVNITSIGQFSQIAIAHPTILNFSSLSPLRDILNKVKNQKGCKCNQKNSLSNYRPQFEAGMAMLSAEDQAKFKSLIDADQICYYSTNTGGQLRKICF